MSFLLGEALTEAVRRTMRGTDVRCAVAFWGAGALGLFAIPKGARIVCNLVSGGTNPQAIRDLMQSGADVRQLNNLHAKVYISNSGAVVCSANASANGLGLEDGEQAHWIEAGVQINLTDDISEWFEIQWATSQAITDQNLIDAQTIYDARRNRRPSVEKISFYDFNAPDMPLMEWVVNAEYEISRANVDRQIKYYDSDMEIIPLDVSNADHDVLCDGRWILSWIRNSRGLPNLRHGLWWWQVDRVLQNAVKLKGTRQLIPGVLMKLKPGPVPFPVSDPRFVATFRSVLSREEFEPFRREDYQTPWYREANIALIRNFWLALKSALADPH